MSITFCHMRLRKWFLKLEHIFQDLWFSSEWICWELVHLAIFPGYLSSLFHSFVHMENRLPFLSFALKLSKVRDSVSQKCFVYKFCRSICTLNSDRTTQNPKLRHQGAICWSRKELFWPYGLDHIFLGTKLFCLSR